MLIVAAADLIAAKLEELNRTHMAAGGGAPLQLEAWEWGRRAEEMRARVDLLAADGPSMPLLAALGAHVLAAMLALDEAELADPASGDEVAA